MNATLTPRDATLSITIGFPSRSSSLDDQFSRILAHDQSSVLLMTLIAICEAIVADMEAAGSAIVLRAGRSVVAMMSLRHVARSI